MKKRLLAIVFIIVMILSTLMTLTSCFKEGDNAKEKIDNDVNDIALKKTIKSSEDKIQLWYYYDSMQADSVDKVIDDAKKFCDENNIPLELNIYNSDIISYKDYELKRNIASAIGNMITIDYASNLYDIAKHHADYSKLANYDKLLDAYKDRFCIPLAINTQYIYIEDAAVKHYGIDTSERPVMTYRDILKIKQQMKEKGARFTLNNSEILQLIRYYLDMNELLIIDGDSKILKDTEKFKEALKKSILDICNDTVKYNNGKLKLNAGTPDVITSSNFNTIGEIYDENVELTLWNTGIRKDTKKGYIKNLLNFQILRISLNESLIDKLSDKIYIVNPFIANPMPSFYMYKKITNDKIYDLANHIISDSTHLLMRYSDHYAYVFPLITDEVKNWFTVNDDWEFSADIRLSNDEKKVINTTFDLLFKDKEKIKDLADCNYYDRNYGTNIQLFTINIILEIARKLSDDELSLEKFDPKNEEILKIIDGKVHEFVTNFNVLNN